MLMRFDQPITLRQARDHLASIPWWRWCRNRWTRFWGLQRCADAWLGSGPDRGMSAASESIRRQLKDLGLVVLQRINDHSPHPRAAVLNHLDIAIELEERRR